MNEPRPANIVVPRELLLSWAAGLVRAVCAPTPDDNRRAGARDGASDDVARGSRYQECRKGWAVMDSFEHLRAQKDRIEAEQRLRILRPVLEALTAKIQELPSTQHGNPKPGFFDATPLIRRIDVLAIIATMHAENSVKV